MTSEAVISPIKLKGKVKQVVMIPKDDLEGYAEVESQKIADSLLSDSVNSARTEEQRLQILRHQIAGFLRQVGTVYECQEAEFVENGRTSFILF